MLALYIAFAGTSFFDYSPLAESTSTAHSWQVETIIRQCTGERVHEFLLCAVHCLVHWQVGLRTRVSVQVKAGQWSTRMVLQTRPHWPTTYQPAR